MLKYKIPQIVTLTQNMQQEKESIEQKKRSTAVLQPLLTLNLIL